MRFLPIMRSRWSDFVNVVCMRYAYPILILLMIVACKPEPQQPYQAVAAYTAPLPPKDSTLPERMVAFAKTLLGTRYQFGCTEPSTGFDCSGFITYVFNHFNITVPRSSVDFTNEGSPVALENARPGDLILFTGTNSKIRKVGHIGMITANDSSGVSFIHATSGRENAVTITQLEEHYIVRFMKVVRMVE